MKNRSSNAGGAGRRILLALALAGASMAPAMAQDVLAGIAPKNRLVFFSASSPDDVEVLKITGLQRGEKLLGIDRRPATGQIFGLGSTSRLYVINTETGAATAVGSGPFTPALSGTHFGFDFNPLVDRIRITSNTGQNLRADPNTGLIAAVDTPLAYAVGDAGAGLTPDVTASGYTNSVNPAPVATTLYNIDVTRDVLVTQNPPNNGTLNTVGSLGVNATKLAGFDISGGTGTAYASLQKKLSFGKSQRASLYTINLATGQATLVGKINGPYPISDITVVNTFAQ